MPRIGRLRWPGPDYRDAMLAMNPAAYWRLGEASGTVARDEMGLNHGTYVGSPTLGVAGALAGDANTAVTLNGTTQYATVPDNAAIRIGLAGTVAVWVKTSSATLQGILSKRTGAGAWWELQVSATGEVIFGLSDGSNTGSATSVAVVRDGTYHHVAAIRNGTTVTFVIDGVRETPIVSGVTGSLADTAVLGIGAYNNGSGAFFNGTIDEPAIWGLARSLDESADLYRVGMGR